MKKLHRFALAVSVLALVSLMGAARGQAAEPAACGKDADCDDDNPCTKDKCDQNTGHCEFKPHDLGNHYGQPIACDDGNACTSDDTCHAGVCAGVNVPDGTACEDTTTCSGPDTCQAGVCTVPGTLVEKIAFASTRDNPTALPQVTGAEIYLMDPDGAHLARLTHNDVFSDAFPALTPDGKGRIVFDSNRNNASGDPVNLVDLFLMKSDGSHQQYLARGSSASWSPDSRSLTFQRSASGTGLPINPLPGAPAADSDIFVARACDLLAGLPPTNITNDPLKIDVDPDWSSDGRKIVFTNSDVGDHPQTPTSSEIWVMNADGSDPVQLTHNAVEERGPAWSPDGTRIAYACKQGTVAPDSDLEICVMNADGSGQTQLTFNTLNDASPKFSPDGQKIVWNHAAGGGAGNRIWVMNADGSDQKAITAPPAGTDLFPAWGFVTQ
jgi:TolB protein